MRSCTRCRVMFLPSLFSIFFFLHPGFCTGYQSSIKQHTGNCYRPRSFAALGMIAAGSIARQTPLLRSGLTDLLLQPFARVPDTLVLVRIWRTQCAHLGRNLSNLLPVDSGHRQASLFRIERDWNWRRQRMLDGMGVAQGKYEQALSFQLGAITEANDFQFLR